MLWAYLWWLSYFQLILKQVASQHQIHENKLMNVCNVKGKEKKHEMHQWLKNKRKIKIKELGKSIIKKSLKKMQNVVNDIIKKNM